MAVTLTGSNGLFTRLGKLFQIAVQVKSFQATLATEIQDALTLDPIRIRNGLESSNDPVDQTEMEDAFTLDPIGIRNGLES